jgi:hypothetical protein
MARAARTRHDAGNTMTLLHEIEWEAPLIEPYRDPDAEALMRKKYGFVNGLGRLLQLQPVDRPLAGALRHPARCPGAREAQT